MMDTVFSISNPATENQINFMRKLIGQKYPADARAAYLTALTEIQYSKARASEIITEMLSLPDVPKEEQDQGDEINDGVYVVGEGDAATVYKVYHTRNGFLATRTLGADGFEYTGQAPLRLIKASDRMTKEQAAEYGALYGRCVNCQKTLTDDVSIAQGYGPVCAQYFA